MRKDDRPTPAAPASPAPGDYLLPEGAYMALREARDQLLLLARLTEPRFAVEDEDVSVAPGALAQCFERFARDLDGVVEAARWPRGEG